MKERILYSTMYLITTVYPCVAAYILVFTARPECITFNDYINSFLVDEESIYIFKGLTLAFIFNFVAFIAVLKIAMSHKYFKYLLAYLWALAAAASIYWQGLIVLYILAAGVVSYEYYKKYYRKSI